MKSKNNEVSNDTIKWNVGDISGHPKLADCYRLGLYVGRQGE